MNVRSAIIGTIMVWCLRCEASHEALAEGRSCEQLRAEFLQQLNDPQSLHNSLIIKINPAAEGAAIQALGGLYQLHSRQDSATALGYAVSGDAYAHSEHLPASGLYVTESFDDLDLKTFLNPDTTPDELCRAIDYVEPDRIVRADGDPADLSELLYGLKNEGQDDGVVDADVDAPEAWEIAGPSEEVVVGVVDSGVDYNHPDLRVNIFQNPLDPVNGLDDDGNGFIDDISGITRVCEGASAFGCMGTRIIGTDTMDQNGHGTHVAGTIAAAANGFGVVGVARNVKILPLRFLNYDGAGSTSDALKVIEYAIDLRTKGINLRVLNNSWGSNSACSSSIKTIVSTATAAGILFVASAGNSAKNLDTNGANPADCPGALAVAASNSKAELASFSNYSAKKVHVAAPGQDIFSTWAPHVDPFRAYFSISGTSMAAPHVSGVAALVFGVKSTLTPAEMITLLSQTVKRYPTLEGKVISGGIVSAKAALLAQ
jgi:serine protease